MIAIAISFSLATVIFMRVALFMYHRWRVYKSTELYEHEDILAVCDRVAMHIIPTGTVTSLLQAGRTFRLRGKIVMSQERLILGSPIGRIIEISAHSPGQAKALGTQRLLIIGQHPSQSGEIRVELVIEDEQKWAREIQNICRGAT